MAVYEFRYRLNTMPIGRLDGSGQVAHDIEVVYRLQGETNGWSALPGHHKTVLVPADGLAAVLAMSNGATKLNAYKQLLVDHRNDPSLPMDTSWQLSNFQPFMGACDEAIIAASGAHYYITVTLSQEYPVTFSL